MDFPVKRNSEENKQVRLEYARTQGGFSKKHKTRYRYVFSLMKLASMFGCEEIMVVLYVARERLASKPNKEVGICRF